MAFAQLTFRESLRDIDACLRRDRQALSHGAFGGALPQYAGRRQRSARLAHLRRIPQRLIGIARGLYLDEPFAVDSKTVYALDSRPSTCAFGVCVGTFRSTKPILSCIRCWICTAISVVHPYYRRQVARRQHPRPFASRAWRVLHLIAASRFCSPAPLPRAAVLRHPGQVESQSAAPLFASGRSQHRPHLRSTIMLTVFYSRQVRRPFLSQWKAVKECHGALRTRDGTRDLPMSPASADRQCYRRWRRKNQLDSPKPLLYISR